MKSILVIGGPNGAGKSTAAAILLPVELQLFEFINADEIARGISPYNPEGAAMTAGRFMIERMRQLASLEVSFAFETTCATRSHVWFLEDKKKKHWQIHLLYLWLSSPEAALARVAGRVREGGHNVPAETIRRRYTLGLRNLFDLYLPLADVAAIYENGDHGRSLVAEKKQGSDIGIVDEALWQQMKLKVQ